MSQQLNFSSNCDFHMIQYPGKIVNVDKMLATLGGISNISQAFCGEVKRLELRYHPENPYNKPACGDSVSCAGLLLSVKVRRSKRNPTRAPQYQIRIMGYCNNNITFESMCDFQYLPLCKDTTKDSRDLIFPLKSLIPQSATDIEYFNQTDVPLLCIPQVFARTDTVHTGIFRGDGQEDGQHEVLGVLKRNNYENRDIVQFSMSDALPTRPDPQIVKRMKVKYVSDEQLDKVKKLFEVCPIWTRVALLYESSVSNEKLKCIIPSLAYYFSAGPWRTLFVRYGYDPRKDFQSRYYQTFDFRLRFRSGMAEYVSNKKDKLKKMQDNPPELSAIDQDVNYPYFEENKLPRSRQCILRYCDIHIPKVQEMLEKIPSPLTGAICNERTGWLPSGFDAQVRQVVSTTIKELLRNHCRKEQIHAELDCVENVTQVGDDDDDAVEDEDFVDVASDDNDLLTDNLNGILEDNYILS